MTNENKYTMCVRLGMDTKLNGNLLSTLIEDALLLYMAKTGEKLTIAQMAVYENFIDPYNNNLPEVQQNV